MQLRTAVESRARQARLTHAVLAQTRKSWRRMEFANLDASWPGVGTQLLLALTAGQRAAAAEGSAAVGRMLDEQNTDNDPAGEVNPASLSGVASDGRPLDTLLYQPVIATKVAIASGSQQRQAMASGAFTLDRIVTTQMFDAYRIAAGMGVTVRKNVGYVRMLTPPSCSRCAILAGRWYRWQADFDRHINCDCTQIPATENAAADLRTDPKTYFHSLGTAEQDRIFTKAGAQAVRDGADLGQVVNARRGAFGLAPAGARLTKAEATALRNGQERGRLTSQRIFGRDLFTTSEGVTRRGIAGKRLGAFEDSVRPPGSRYARARAPRLMPESIYQIAAGDRDEAIRLLRRFGYIT